MPEIIDLVKRRQDDDLLCRVCGRSISEVQKEIVELKVAEYIKEHKGKMDEADLASHRAWYENRKHGKDCGDCLNLTTTECKDIIRVLRLRMAVLEKRLGDK
jgi:hypothetical protein